VGVLGILIDNARLYSTHAILLSGSCKQEDAEAHADLLKTTLESVNARKSLTHTCIICLASDREARQGHALVLLMFWHVLSSRSSLHPLLGPLSLMDLHVGDNDLTVNKDYKHVFKRFQNTLLRKKGVLVLGVYITPAILRTHLRDAGSSNKHIKSVLNVADKQDVKLAYRLL
jgi:hypothetical protein